MAAPVTVKDVRANELNRIQQVVTALDPEIKRLQAALTIAQAEVAATGTQLATLQAAASTLQQKLAAATMGADRHEFELALDENLLEQRRLEARRAAAQDTATTVTRGLARATADAGKAVADAAQATQALAAATADAATAAQWEAALAGTVAAAVAGAQTSATAAAVTAATSRLGELLGGAALLDLVRARVQDAVSTADEPAHALARAVDAADATAMARSPVDGAADAARSAYERARTAVESVQGAPADLAAALLALEKVTMWPAPSAAVQTRTNERGEAAVDTGAAANEQSLRAARVTDRSARSALAAKTEPKKALDPAYDPGTDDGVKAERDAAAAAGTALAAATTALTPELVTVLDRWDIAVPPDVMQAAVAAVVAEGTVDRLAAHTDPVALGAALSTAESVYAAALQQQLTVRERQDAAAARLAEQLETATPAEAVPPVPVLPRTG